MNLLSFLYSSYYMPRYSSLRVRNLMPREKECMKYWLPWQTTQGVSSLREFVYSRCGVVCGERSVRGGSSGTSGSGRGSKRRQHTPGYATYFTSSDQPQNQPPTQPHTKLETHHTIILE
jgi:hypothetical protein